MTLHLITPRLFLAYVADIETLDWVGQGRCGVYYMTIEARSAGAVSLTSKSRSMGEIGYKVEPDFRNRGFATEAVEAVAAHALSHHGFSLLTAVARTDNPASRRVLEKTGFIRIGTRLCWLDEFHTPMAMALYRRRLDRSPSPIEVAATSADLR